MEQLQEPTYLSLVALANEPLHGYGVIQEVQRLSGGSLRLRPGTLYAMLDRLEAEGNIQVDRETIVDGRLRRYYRLTEAGSRLLADASRHRAATSKEALRRLRITGAIS